MLGADDPLPRRPRRVVVAGVSGSGKTTLAGRIADVTGGRHVEIDALYHGEHWQPRTEFVADVEAFTATDAWTTEWQYRTVRSLVASRADLLVWLDLPYYRMTLPRLIRRTLHRRRRMVALWNGNIEPPLRTFFTDRDHIVRWSIRTHRKYSEMVPLAAIEHPDMVVVRLRSSAEVDRWVAGPLAASLPSDGRLGRGSSS